MGLYLAMQLLFFLLLFFFCFFLAMWSCIMRKLASWGMPPLLESPLWQAWATGIVCQWEKCSAGFTLLNQVSLLCHNHGPFINSGSWPLEVHCRLHSQPSSLGDLKLITVLMQNKTIDFLSRGVYFNRGTNPYEVGAFIALLNKCTEDVIQMPSVLLLLHFMDIPLVCYSFDPFPWLICQWK